MIQHDKLTKNETQKQFILKVKYKNALEYFQLNLKFVFSGFSKIQEAIFKGNMEGNG